MQQKYAAEQIDKFLGAVLAAVILKKPTYLTTKMPILRKSTQQFPKCTVCMYLEITYIIHFVLVFSLHILSDFEPIFYFFKGTFAKLGNFE